MGEVGLELGWLLLGRSLAGKDGCRNPTSEVFGRSEYVAKQPGDTLSKFPLLGPLSITLDQVGRQWKIVGR